MRATLTEYLPCFQVLYVLWQTGLWASALPVTLGPCVLRAACDPDGLHYGGQVGTSPSTVAVGGWTGADTYHAKPIRHSLLGGGFGVCPEGHHAQSRLRLRLER